MVGPTTRWGVAVIGLTLVAGLGAGFRRVSEWKYGRAQVAWSIPFGSGPGEIGRGRGMNGRVYGPLAIAVNGSGRRRRLVVADTYHGRILEISAHAVRTIPIADSFIDAVCLSPGGREIYAVDDRTTRVWAVDSAGAKRWAALAPAKPGYTQSIWDMAAGGAGSLWIDWIRVGRGSVETALSRVQAKPGQGAFRQPIAERGAVASLVRSPAGNFYVALPGNSARSLQVIVYSPAGVAERSVYVQTSTPMQTPQLLGVDVRGDLYVDLGSQGHGAGPIEIFNRDGKPVAHFNVPPSPVGTWHPGYVQARGTVYLIDSTAHRFRVLRYRVYAVQRWIWRWP